MSWAAALGGAEQNVVQSWTFDPHHLLTFKEVLKCQQQFHETYLMWQDPHFPKKLQKCLKQQMTMVQWVNKRVTKAFLNRVTHFRACLISLSMHYDWHASRFEKWPTTALLVVIGNSESNDAMDHGVTMQKNEVARALSIKDPQECVIWIAWLLVVHILNVLPLLLTQVEQTVQGIERKLAWQKMRWFGHNLALHWRQLRINEKATWSLILLNCGL